MRKVEKFDKNTVFITELEHEMSLILVDPLTNWHLIIIGWSPKEYVYSSPKHSPEKHTKFLMVTARTWCTIPTSSPTSVAREQGTVTVKF